MKKPLFVALGLLVLATACKKDEPAVASATYPQTYTFESNTGVSAIRTFTENGELNASNLPLCGELKTYQIEPGDTVAVRTFDMNLKKN